MLKLKVPEKDVQKAILAYLKVFGGVQYWRANSGSTAKSYTNKAGSTNNYWIKFGCEGLPDINGFKISDGKFVAIECKSYPDGKLKVEQASFLINLILAGGYGIVASSVSEVSIAINSDKTYLLQQVYKYTRKKDRELVFKGLEKHVL